VIADEGACFKAVSVRQHLHHHDAELRVFKMKKTAHRKIKPKGDLSYSLAEVISLAFAPSPKAPCRILD
jgi:hypothetical protein